MEKKNWNDAVELYTHSYSGFDDSNVTFVLQYYLIKFIRRYDNQSITIGSIDLILRRS